jgi:hypothetical protein
MIKSRKIGVEGRYDARVGEIRKARTVMVGKSDGKGQPAKPKYKW